MPPRNFQAAATELAASIARLNEANAVTRAEAARAICREAYKEVSTFTRVLLSDALVITRLIDLVDDSEAAVQESAVGALAAIVSAHRPDPRAFEPLKSKLADPRIEVREWAVVGIAALEGQRERWKALMPALADSALAVRMAACRAYAFAKPNEMAPALRREVIAKLDELHTGDRSAKVRSLARNALELLG
jgi:hypothetical protein